jgi:hypothetical protein
MKVKQAVVHAICSVTEASQCLTNAPKHNTLLIRSDIGCPQNLNKGVEPVLKLKLVKMDHNDFFLMTYQELVRGDEAFVTEALAGMGLTVLEIANEFKCVEHLYTSLTSSQPLMAGVSRRVC